MVKSNRNGKATTAEFTGFAAFASHTSSAATAAAAAHLARNSPKGQDVESAAPKSKLGLSPIYTGSDVTAIQIFKRIAKKDATTKSRALSELANYAFPCSEKDEPLETQLPKSEQVRVLSHFYFLFVNKLIHENNASVRIEAVRVFGNTSVHVPNACFGLLRLNVSSDYISNCNENAVGSIGNAIGWIYFLNSSQTMEEVRAAKRSWKLLVMTLEKNKNEQESSRSVNEFVTRSIIMHAEAILKASSRPSNLADAFSVASKKNLSAQNSRSEQGGKGKRQQGDQKKDSNSSSLVVDESEIEAMEERYERVVLMTLRAMESFFREYEEVTIDHDAHGDIMEDPSILWKHLNSPKGSFRRSTFSLVACIAQHAPSIVHKNKEREWNTNTSDRKQCNLSKLLVNVLSSERDPANFSSMFEMLLLYIVSFRKFHNAIDVAWEVNDDSYYRYCPGMDADAVVKSLSKALRRSCYGSPASQWTPTMLPILATVPSSEKQLQLLSSLWNGRAAAVSIADSIAIAAATTECAMYILVKTGSQNNSQNETEDDSELAMDVSQIFLDCLQYYLISSRGGTASASSEMTLRTTLIRDLLKLDTITHERNSCIFLQVRHWFWSEGMGSTFDQLNDDAMNRLSDILDGMNTASGVRDVERGPDNFQFSLRTLFWKQLSREFETVPSNSLFRLLVSIMRFCTTDVLFNSISSKELLCTNTLIPWIFNDQLAMSSDCLESLFQLLFLTMQSIGVSETIIHIWELCFKEDPTKDNTLSILTVALKVLTTEFRELISKLSCPSFQGFVSEVAKYAEAMYHEHAGYDSMQDHLFSSHLTFLQLSTDSNDLSHQSLVDSDTIELWTQNVLNSDFEYGIYKKTHILLEVLLSYARRNPMKLSRESVMNLVMYAWREGGPAWESDNLKTILASDEPLRNDFLSSSSRTLTHEVKGDNDRWEKVGVDFYSFLWADRAFRALQIYMQASNTTNCKLHFLGLNDAETWISAMESKLHCDILYLSLMYLLEHYSNLFERKSVISGIDSNVALYILMGLACMDGQKTRRCCNFMHILGNDLLNHSIEQCAFELIDLLSLSLNQSKGSQGFLRRACIVLDWLVGMLLPKYTPASKIATDQDDINQNELKEGDEVWYVTNGENVNSERKKARVLKVHTDDFPNLYFTIQVLSNEATTDTRQTIAQRLKRNEKYPIQSVSDSEISGESLVPRLEHSIVSKIIKPCSNGSSFEAKFVGAEMLNIVLSFCGLQRSGGIGTTRFDSFQAFSTMEQDLRIALSDFPSNPKLVSQHLDYVTISLGYGLSTSRSFYNCQILQYNCDWLISKLQEVLIHNRNVITYDTDDGTSLCLSLMRWLTITSPIAMYDDNATFFWELLETVTPSAININDEVSMFISRVVMIIDAIQELNKQMDVLPMNVKAKTISAEQNCVSKLLNLFIKWDSSMTNPYALGEYFIDDNLIQEHESASSWLHHFKSFLTKQVADNLGAVNYGAKMHVDGLMKCLSSPEKQWYAFQILFASAKKGDMIYSDENVELSQTTTKCLHKWMNGLDEEEALEIEEDVYSSAKWLPQSLMSSIESWETNSVLVEDGCSLKEHNLMERLLLWLLCLEHLDSAGKADMRNRTHITSYIDKTNAIKEVFDIAMSFASFSKQDQSTLLNSISISSSETSFSLSQLSTLAIFRSIESIPTLCKVWWTDDCPRSLSSQVSKFVEGMVAPEILKRELERINQSSDLGELSVSGSCVSREVIATYMQDECKLSVLIRVPPSFPLRNAEVDCQKTLGISEKRWRFWSLQIMRMLNSQDGSILDALLLWKQNVDKEFEGVEPCPVCYSVLCVKTHAMPNLECKTCHNRFHSGCLYKWFHSSGKSQCVLCQQPWNGIKIS